MGDSYESIPFSIQLLNDFFSFLFIDVMVTLYSKSKPPSKVDKKWIYWSNEDLSRIDHETISALVVIGRKGSINIIYKPTPVLNSLGKLEAIVGNIHDMKSTQSIFKIEGDEVGSCFAVETYENIPTNLLPEHPLSPEAVNGTCYQEVNDDLSLVALPNVAPMPYGFDIKSSELDEDFINEMEKISVNHGFWARQMYNAFDQHDKDNGTEQVVENLTNLIKDEPVKGKRKMASAKSSATKNFSTVYRATSGPIVDVSQAGEKHEAEQNVVKSYFMPNPTPQPHPLQDVSGLTQPVLSQMIETLKSIGSSLTSNLPTSIIVASQQTEEDKEMQDSNNTSLQLFYASAEFNWEEGTFVNVKKANFSVGFNNVLAKKSAKMKVVELTNLFTTIFSLKKDEGKSFEEVELGRMQSMQAFDPKFVGAHINANFSTTDLDVNSASKSTSINAFSYAPQNNRSKTLEKLAEIQAQRNEALFNINEKDKKETSAYIEGIGQIESTEDVISACANICGTMFAIVDTTGNNKPMLYQVATKIIFFLRGRMTSDWLRDHKNDCAQLPFVFMWEIQRFIQSLAKFSKNSVNVRHIQTNVSNLDTSEITSAVKSISTFMTDMSDHVNNDTVPTSIPRYARNFITIKKEDDTPPSSVPNITNENNKRKPDSSLEQGKKKKKDTSEQSSKGIFHASPSESVTKILPPKDLLSQPFCLNFCAQGRVCDKPQTGCKFGKHYSNYKFIPAEDRKVILNHMDASKLLWFDETTMMKHNMTDEIPSEYKYLLGNASGPKAKSM